MSLEDAQNKFSNLMEDLIVTQQATKGSWFGLPCLKIRGKVFMAQWTNGDAIFKLRNDAHAKAMGLDGSTLFQPMPDRNPMREWVQVPPQHANQWHEFALSARGYVREIADKTKK